MYRTEVGIINLDNIWEKLEVTGGEKMKWEVRRQFVWWRIIFRAVFWNLQDIPILLTHWSYPLLETISLNPGYFRPGLAAQELMGSIRRGGCRRGVPLAPLSTRWSSCLARTSTFSFLVAAQVPSGMMCGLCWTRGSFLRKRQICLGGWVKC